MGFVNGTCVRSSYLASAPLLEQWDRCNLVVLNWILSSLSQDVYLGHVFSDNAQTVWKEFEETYDRIDGSIVFNLLVELGNHGKLMKLMQFLMGLDDVYQPIRSNLLTREVLPEVKDVFVILVNEESHRGIPATTAQFNKPQDSVFVSRVNDVKRSNKCHTIERCFEIIGYPLGFKRNPNLKVNGSFNNNKSNNVDLKGKSVGTNDLKTTTGTLSFTHEQVVKVMNFLNDKSSSTSHANMADSSVCSFFNFNSGANQHMTNNIKNMIHVVDVTDLNPTIGHPNGTLAKITHIGNLRLNYNVILFDVLVIPEYYDLKKETVIGTGSESVGLYLFDVDCDKIAVSNQNLTNKTPIRPNDDEEDSPSRDGRAHQPVNGSEIDQPGHDGDNSTTHGRVHQPVLVFQNYFPSNTEEGGPMRSQRISKFPAKLNEFVLDIKVKYGLNKYANHSFLKPENYSFVSNLNKGHEPSSYEEAVKDIRWVNAMNEEMNALYENKTWDITDLPLNRKPIGCKWVYKIKYKSNGEVERYKSRLVAKGLVRKKGLIMRKCLVLL
uniref:Reverse transcriptase Ty1/copia-type domain-containing protein n=1 Tax=Tanacetum cinerariifolium TaxID=118510 RepID=A0A6L2MT00_TANCI|nr:hypothetical protein [Tanacetum cinerariifolium]